MIYIGLDEAGLGPTLGPMVIAGFSFTGIEENTTLKKILQQAIGEPGTSAPRLEVGDSKLIHRGSKKLARIERTVLATLGWLHGHIPQTTGELLKKTQRSFQVDNLVPWYEEKRDQKQDEEILPIAASLSEIEESSALLREVAQRQGVRILAYNADVVSEYRFNQELKQEYTEGGSKNTWSTQQVINHAGHCVHTLSPKHIEAENFKIECDRAGARMMYGSQLIQRFQPQRLETIQETNHRSHYRIKGFQDINQDQEIEIAFQVRADSVFTQVAWASCLAKYLREIIMRRFNRYWASCYPQIKPTAGYPQDAKRFVKEIRKHVPSPRFSDHQWIRMA